MRNHKGKLTDTINKGKTNLSSAPPFLLLPMNNTKQWKHAAGKIKTSWCPCSTFSSKNSSQRNNSIGIYRQEKTLISEMPAVEKAK